LTGRCQNGLRELKRKGAKKEEKKMMKKKVSHLYRIQKKVPDTHKQRGVDQFVHINIR